MKIAVASNNGKEIFKGMLGMARAFYIYKNNNKNFEFFEKRDNPYEKSLQHLKTLDVYELINDCSTVIAGKIGKKGIDRLKDRGMNVFICEGKILDNLLKLGENE